MRQLPRVLEKWTGGMGKGEEMESKVTFQVGRGGRGLWETAIPKFPQKGKIWSTQLLRSSFQESQQSSLRPKDLIAVEKKGNKSSLGTVWEAMSWVSTCGLTVTQTHLLVVLSQEIWRTGSKQCWPCWAPLADVNLERIQPPAAFQMDVMWAILCKISGFELKQVSNVSEEVSVFLYSTWLCCFATKPHCLGFLLSCSIFCFTH